jgi:ankyrin repeat protein
VKIFALALIIFLPFKLYALSGWDQYNDPELMKIDYQRNFDKLPLFGELTKKPWNGNYWPTHKGGITYRWHQPRAEDPTDTNPRFHYEVLTPEAIDSANLEILSPAEKYDLFMGRDDFPLTTYEKKRTKINLIDPESEEYDEEFEIPNWEGLCHAWAPAALSYKEPGAVKITGPGGREIQFGSSDIKALLTYFLHVNRDPKNIKTNFLGTRCWLDFKKLEEQLRDGEITQEKFDEEISATSCLDTNAGAFHVVLANQIALLDEGFVADVFRYVEVWNYPVFWYSSKVIEEKEGASEGAAEGTIKELRVVTLIKHAHSMDQSWYPVGLPQGLALYFDDIYSKKRFEYTLELDKKGNIIGGEWISDNRPDFVWKQSIPDFKGYFKPLKDIYEKSQKTLENIQKFWKALEEEDLEAISYLLREIDIDIQNGEGDTPLHFATEKENLEILKLLIERGADLNSQNIVGQTALHLAAGLGNLELAKTLANAGAKVDLRDLSGQSPFHLAAWNQNFEMVIYLIEKGCDKDAIDSNGKTSLHWAAILGNIQIADFLITHKVNLEVKDHSGKTPFYWSVLKNKVPVANSLINAGAKINEKDNKGMAPLHIAVYKGHPEIAQLILDNKGEINILEGSGKTPLHMAVIEGDLEMVKLLFKYNPKVNPVDNFDKTPLDYGADFPEIIKFLKEKGAHPVESAS